LVQEVVLFRNDLLTVCLQIEILASCLRRRFSDDYRIRLQFHDHWLGCGKRPDK
jgi:hypothetical protein